MRIVYTDEFLADLERQAAWYAGKQDQALGLRYAAAVIDEVETLAANPSLGMKCAFRNRKLSGLRRYLLNRPFHTHLVFYRVEKEELVAVRVISGFRDLPRRLLQPPGAE